MADHVSIKKDLFAINGGQGPQQIYFLHRKGWTIDDSRVNDSIYLQGLISKGCKFLLINKHTASVLPFSSKWEREVFKNEDFVIYSLAHK